VLDVLWERAGGKPGVGVAVADIDAAIGRGHDDMRTPLNLGSLAADGRVERLADGRWALTAAGVAWLDQDHDLSDR
ncbi:MAG: hypothetical protein QOI64_1171, partial [Solirubrobacteraceae bacterium]|nr:hypothetical protein [Solirubrobacteraceae bacterium]